MELIDITSQIRKIKITKALPLWTVHNSFSGKFIIYEITLKPKKIAIIVDEIIIITPDTEENFIDIP